MASPSSSVSVRGNLPAELTAFVGRRRELADVRQELERARLVTLCGVGGVGKTRLAVKAAEEVRRHFADGCWLVELSAVAGTQQVPRAVAAALEIPDRSGADPVDLLVGHLADKRVLLVLDTCEHVADACALLAELLLRAAPGLQIIATSRRPLTVLGECTYQVSPLPLPGASGAGDAVELFAERVRAVLPGFELSARNLDEVTELCRRLDGIPLALELAAMRLRVMSLSQVVARLDRRFRLLDGVRIGGGRQRTLLTTVRWSYELCGAAEQLLWARLAVFPGPFDLASAEAVCGDARLPAEEVLDALAGLVEKSVVSYDPRTCRYRMLDTIREYAGDLLDELGERELLRLRHRDSCRAFVGRAFERWCGSGQVGLFDAIRQALPDLRAAFEYSLSTPGEERAGLEMIATLSFFWFEGLEAGTGREWLAEALRLVPEPCPERGWGLRASAYVAMLNTDYDRSLALLDEAAAIAAGEPGSMLLGHVLVARGTSLTLAGRVGDGLAAYREAMVVFEEHGFDEPHALCTMVLQAGTHIFRKEFDEALALLERCLPLAVERGDLWSEGFARWMRAFARWASGDPTAAVGDLRRCSEIKEAVGDLYHVALAFDLYALCLGDLGEPEKGALLLGAADGLWKRMRSDRGPQWGGVRRRGEDALVSLMGRGAFTEAHAKGLGLSSADALLVVKGERAVPAAPAGRSPLTRRELEVAALVAEGLSNRRIAERLVISKRTVDSHLEHILSKLGFISRAQIAAWAAAPGGDES